MDFFDLLGEYGAAGLLSMPSYKLPTFINEEKVIEALKDIVLNKRKTLVYGDYDADGGYCKELLKDTFNYLEFTNFECFPYSMRTHAVDSNAINRAITGSFEYMIICDAGSSDLRPLQRLMMHGIKVILLDHHKTPYVYRDFGEVNIINTAIENLYRDDEIVASAGSLTFMVCEKLISALGREELKSNVALALASLYADTIDMSSELNRAIYYKAVSLEPHELPKLIQRFMNDRVKFNRRFLEFQVNPRINSLFRSERFDLLNKLLDWTPYSSVNLATLMEDIIGHHAHNASECAKAADLMEVEVMGNFVVGNLTSVMNQIDMPEKVLANHTGLVANKLISKYRKTAIVVADTGQEVKGSLRDPYGRNYLEIFQTFSNSNGHNAAFGIHINYIEYMEFLSYVRVVDSKYAINSVGNEPIILMHNHQVPDRDMIMNMGLYNEFSGIKFPYAYVSKVWLKGVDNGYKSQWGYNYKWGEFSVKSPNMIRPGSQLVLKPYKGSAIKNEGVQIMVHEVSR